MKKITAILITAVMILTMTSPVTGSETFNPRIDDLSQEQLQALQNRARPLEFDVPISATIVGGTATRGPFVRNINAYSVEIEHPGILTIDMSRRHGILTVYDSEGKRVTHHGDQFNTPSSGNVRFSVEVGIGTHYMNFQVQANTNTITLSTGLEETCVWGEWKMTQRPDCDTVGSQVRDCTYCDEFEEEEIPALDCEWGEWRITLEPTCDIAGIQRRTCENCIKFEEETIVETGCDIGEWVTVQAPTCDTVGRQQRDCNNCSSKIDEEEMPATGCNMGEWVIVTAADCTRNGVRIRECLNECGEEEIDSIDRLEHTLSSWATIRATCANDGGRVRGCEDCDYEEVEVTEKTGFGGQGVCADCGVVSRQRGDVDGFDGVTINDALEILKHLAGISTLTDCNLAAALITGDAQPTINDALEILKYLAGIIDEIV
jgi:hypothetical protein